MTGAHDGGVDPYAVLGVARDTSVEEIRKAYVTLARSTHPDVRGDDPAAAEQMRRINQAWETLSNADTRAALDRRLHHPPLSGGHGPQQAHRSPSSDPSQADYSADDDFAFGHDDFDGDDRAITEGDLPSWMRLGAPASFAVGIFAIIFGALVGGWGLVLGLLTLGFSVVLFVLSPFVVLVRSRGGPMRR